MLRHPLRPEQQRAELRPNQLPRVPVVDVFGARLESSRDVFSLRASALFSRQTAW
jgi:hypothetical protein